MDRIKKYAVVLLSTLLLYGCGLKGDLYSTLPDDEDMTITK